MGLVVAVASTTARDVRVDVLRGLALVTIFINHIPGNVFGSLTSRNFGLSDAAEVFVLLAGYAAAFAYDRKFAAGRRWEMTIKAWQRAGALYIWHIATTLAAVAIFAFAAAVFARPGYLLDTVPNLYINIWPFGADPVNGFIGILTLGHQFGYFNILPMYMVLLLGLPLIMLMARQGLGLLIAASVTLWFLAGCFRIDVPNYPTPGGWFFNPFAWQVIFVVGFALAIRMREGRPISFNPFLYAAALAYLVFCFYIVRFKGWDLIPKLPPFPERLTRFDKGYVSLPRLLHILALAYVVMLSPIGQWMKRIGEANPLAIMGRNSLPVFAWGSLLSMACFIARTELHGGLWLDVLLTGGGIAILYAIAVNADNRRPVQVPAAVRIRSR